MTSSNTMRGGNHKVLDANGNAITATAHIGHRNPFRYRGYFYDRETGLYYLKSRYYDQQTGDLSTWTALGYPRCLDLQVERLV